MAATPSIKMDPIGGDKAYLQQAAVSNCITHGVFVANSPKNVAVPAGTRAVIIICADDVWYHQNQNPTVPASDIELSEQVYVPAGSGRLIPLAGRVGNQCNLICATAAKFAVEFLA